MSELSGEMFEEPKFPVDFPEKCRACIALARMALTYENAQRDIQGALGVVFSGEGLTERLAEQAEKLIKLTPEQARSFVKSREGELRTEIGQEVDRKERVCDTQVRFAEYIIAKCKEGVIETQSVTPGVYREVWLCGTKEPERVKGLENVEFARVFHSKEEADSFRRSISAESTD